MTTSSPVDGPDGSSPFNRPRAFGGVGLLISAVALMLVDAFRPDYAVDSIQLGLLLGTGTVLLGVEAGKKLWGR